MATYVTVQRPAHIDKSLTSHADGLFHGARGKIVGFSVYVDPSGFPRERVLVALEDGMLVSFYPSELWADKVVHNRQGE